MSRLSIVKYSAWIFFALVLLSSVSVAQFSPNDFVFEPVGLQQGLPHSVVTAIVQDKQGMLWFATGNGLAKYDGYQFEIYYADQTTNALPGSLIQDVVLAGDSLLCVGTRRGLSLFRIKEQQFRNVALSGSGLAPASASHLAIGPRNELWFTTSNQLHRLNLKTMRLTTIEGREKSRFSFVRRIWAIHCDSDSIIWLGTRGEGIWLYDYRSDTFSRLPATDEHDTQGLLNSLQINCFSQDSEGNVWVGTRKGISVFDKEKQAFWNYSYTDYQENDYQKSSVSSLSAQIGTHLWVGTQKSGILLFDLRQRKYTHLLSLHETLSVMNSEPVSCILNDNLGNIWIGTIDGGAYKLSFRRKPFRNYSNLPGIANSLQAKAVYSVFEDKHGLLWVGTTQGIDVINRRTGNYRHLTYKYSTEGTIGPGLVSGICQDKNGDIWSVSWDGSVDRIDTSTLRARFYRGGQNDLSGWAFRAICADSQGNIWLGSLDQGLEFFDNAAHAFRRVTLSKDTVAVYSLFCDNDSLWIGVAGGLRLYDIKQKKEAESPHLERLNAVIDVPVTVFNRDKQGNWWVGTEGQGVFILNPEKGIPLRITRGDGLAGDGVYGIYFDRRNQVWISTNAGISCLNRNTLRFRNYDVNDGIQSNEFKWGSHFQSLITGEIFFGGAEGLTCFFPNQVFEDTIPPVPLITGLRVFNRRIDIGQQINGQILLPRHISYCDTIELNSRNNDFTLEFAGLHFATPAKQIYRYRLEGYDSNWRYTTAGERSATYTNLNPGTYRFYVNSANSDGKWARWPRKLTVIVLPPWWHTWWARGLFVLAGVAVLVILRHISLAKQRLENRLTIQQIEFEKQKAISEKDRQLDQVKIRFFMNVSHEFRTPLTLILGPVEKLLNSSRLSYANIREQLGLVHRNANRLLRLINQLLDLRKLETGTLKLNLVQGNLTEYITKIVESFEPLAERQCIDYKYVICNNQCPESLCFDPDKLEKILYNLISNAFKYTPDGGKILVELSILHAEAENYQMTIAVQDSGIGIAPDSLPRIFDRFYQVHDAKAPQQSGTGIGLSLTKELIELYGGSIHVRSTPGQGSRFTIELPVRGHIADREAAAVCLSDVFVSESVEKTQLTISDQQSESGGNTHSSENPQLLVVDDNPDIVEFIALNLSDTYRLLKAYNGDQGMRLAIEHIPDLIISDVMMPLTTGVELCKRLKTDRYTSHIPIILLTARSSAEHQMEGLDAGADDYIVKPFNINVLTAKIRNTLKSRENYRIRILDSNEPALAVPQAHGEKSFLDTLIRHISQNLADEQINAEALAQNVAMSQTQLYRKLKALTGQTVNEFVRNIKLNHAANMLANNGMSVKEVAYMTGFSDRRYFSKCFKEKFGRSPSDFIDQKGTD